ncbi:hypothetical protein BC751_2166 [Cecembia calidifontis]|uniref:Uncharacterized protein n=1 Tax=Cecembia calidifontis TaxID=1187080 RepID=A0A4Q7P9J5_9BACT|nr:hypothetical protein BC751_2166 [Cecembia calidifontis]
MGRFLLYCLISFLVHATRAQSVEGVFCGNLDGNTYVLKIREQGGILMGEWFDESLSQKDFIGKKQENGFKGILDKEGEEQEVEATIFKKKLQMVFVESGKGIKMERISKSLDYDFSKIFPEANKSLRNRIIGVWILKERYRVENGQKIYSEETGKDYLTSINPDGKYLLDIRGIRDVDEKMARELNIPPQHRLKASDLFEMSQMLSWELVGNNIKVFPTQAIPGKNVEILKSIEFKDQNLVLTEVVKGWVEVYERKK